MNQFEEVANFRSMAEARVAESFLRAHGIDAKFADSHVHSVLPIRLSVKGFRLIAPREQANEARRLLDEISSNPERSDEDSK